MPNHAIRRTSLALATATLTAAAMLGTISPASAISGGRNADGDVAATASARVILGNTDCSATRISPEWLITAKHCVGQDNRSLVSLGGNRQGEQRHAAEVVMHPTADLAVIKLDQPSNGPVAKLSGQHLTPGTHARAVGWGGGTQNYFPMVQQGDLEVQRRVFNIDPDNREADLLEVGDRWAPDARRFRRSSAYWRYHRGRSQHVQRECAAPRQRQHWLVRPRC